MEKIFRNWDFLLLLIVLCLGIAFWREKKEKKEIMPSAEENKISLTEEKKEIMPSAEENKISLAEEKERNEEAEIISSIRRDEISLAREALDKYANEVCKEIDKEYEKIEEKRMNPANIGTLVQIPYANLQMGYTGLRFAYFLISNICRPDFDVKVITHDIEVISKNSAKGRLVVKASPNSSTPEKYVSYFTVHIKPYEFLATYGRYGDKWFVEDCRMIGWGWDLRPFPD